MTSLDSLLSRVVERKGFTVQGSDAEALLAKKGDETLLAAWKLDGPLVAADAQMFLAAMEQIHAASGILVAPKGVDAGARDLLAVNRGVDVWAEARLVHEVGEALVGDAMEGVVATPAPAAAPAAPAPTSGGHARYPSTPPTDPNSKTAAAVNSGAAYFMPSRKKEVPVDMQAQIPQGKAGSLGYAWGGPMSTVGNPGIAQVRNGRNPTKKVDQWGNLIDPNAAPREVNPLPPGMSSEGATGTAAARRPRHAAAAAPAAPTASKFVAEPEAYEIITTPKKPAAQPGGAIATSAPPACSTLKLNLAQDAAVAKVGKPGNAKLALVPHVAFEYDLAMEREGMPAPVTGKGAVLVNSLTGELREVPALDYADAEPAGARKDAEKLTAVDVYDKVKSLITKTYSRTISVERDVAGNTVMQNLKLAPDPEEMGLEHRGIVHVPVWEITASTGVVKVDAFTGNVL